MAKGLNPAIGSPPRGEDTTVGTRERTGLTVHPRARGDMQELNRQTSGRSVHPARRDRTEIPST